MRNQSRSSHILIIHQIIKGVCIKNLEATLLFKDFFNKFNFTLKGKRADTTSIWSPKRICYHDNDVLQSRKSMVAQIFLYCHGSLTRKYITNISIYNLARLHATNIYRSNERKYFCTKKARSRQYPTETITDVDDADDLVLFPNTSAQT